MTTQLENQDVLNAYQAIAQKLLAFVGDTPWDEVGTKCIVYSQMIESETWRKSGDLLDYFGQEIPMDVSRSAREGIYYLRKHLMDLTGDRIWGLTFTLYPTGKFNIEYDYNKPEDYDDSDETITGEEINQSLFDLGFRAAPTDEDPKGNE